MVRSSGNPHLTNDDRIDKAKAIIDDLITTWGPHTGLTVGQVRVALKALFSSNRQYAWYVDTFSERGWETMIAYRLMEAGYKKLGWGWKAPQGGSM